VNSCLDAERAYWPRVVHRFLYSDLISNPGADAARDTGFSGEPYAAGCVSPLQKRINSSNAPSDFQLSDAAIDQSLAEKARKLSAALEQTPQRDEAFPEVAEMMEAGFNQQGPIRCPDKQ
jgi:hypothetical protein